MKKLILLIVSVLLLVGCNPKVTYGEVINKEHNEAWRQLVIIPIHISNGETSNTIMMPYWIFHEENWKIEIRGKDKNGNLATETYYITEDLYNEIHIGDMYEYREEIDTTEEPTRKIKKSEVSDEELEKYKEVD